MCAAHAHAGQVNLRHLASSRCRTNVWGERGEERDRQGIEHEQGTTRVREHEFVTLETSNTPKKKTNTHTHTHTHTHARTHTCPRANISMASSAHASAYRSAVAAVALDASTVPLPKFNDTSDTSYRRRYHSLDHLHPSAGAQGYGLPSINFSLSLSPQDV